jgi:hypothetical protein
MLSPVIECATMRQFRIGNETERVKESVLSLRVNISDCSNVFRL